MMRMVVAPDSFKGSASARVLCDSIRAGIHDVVPDAQVVLLPMADGGEGTTENLVQATGGTIIAAAAADPLGRQIEAFYGILGDRATAVIEVAQASGLTRLTLEERNPLLACSSGTGILIRHALDAGYRKFIVGLGGSAVNDGGAGMLQALGARLLGSGGEPLPEGGAALERLASIDLSGLDPRLAECEFKAASDVVNPLCGPDGASAVFGPQKGASPDMVRLLDRALQRYGEALEQASGQDVMMRPGSGAAGGIGASLLAVMKARLRPGIEMMMDAVRLDDHIQGADLIFTGEGRLDSQTLSGKVVAGICGRAKPYGVKVIALCGSLELTAEEMDGIGLAAAFSIAPGPCTLETAMRSAPQWARYQTRQILRLLRRS